MYYAAAALTSGQTWGGACGLGTAADLCRTALRWPALRPLLFLAGCIGIAVAPIGMAVVPASIAAASVGLSLAVLVPAVAVLGSAVTVPGPAPAAGRFLVEPVQGSVPLKTKRLALCAATAVVKVGLVSTADRLL